MRKKADYKVSIIVHNYNYEKYIARAIDSCLAQTHPHIEVIVVDDGSTDNSKAIIQRYGEKIRAIHQSNSGQASALNAGFTASTGNIVAILDSDDYFLPDKISEIVRCYERYPNIGWCSNALKVVDVKDSTIGYSLEKTSKPCDFRKSLRLGYLPFYPPPTSGLSFRRGLLKKILPMPEAIGAHDRYLCWYAMYLSRGYFLDQPLSVRLVHDKNFTNVVAGTEGKKLQRYNNNKAIVYSALYLRRVCPDMARFCDRKFATGVGLSRLTDSPFSVGEPVVKEYLSQVNLLEKAYIYLESLYQGRPWRREPSFRQA